MTFYSLPPDRIQVLLAEYSLSLDQAKYHAAIIWQTAAVFLNLSLLGLIYVAGIKARGEVIAPLVSIVAISIGSIIMLYSWYSLFRRWNSYLRLAYLRMGEIEYSLDMHLASDGEFFRSLNLGEPLPYDENPEIARRHKNLNEDRRYRGFHGRPQFNAVRFVVYALIAGWIIVAAAKVVAMLT